MLVVKIELWPYGYKDQAVTLGRLDIINDGTGSQTKGNYKVRQWRKGDKGIDDEVHQANDKYNRESTILDWSRLGEPVWKLVLKALENIYND